jgi:hypothetical protein
MKPIFRIALISLVLLALGGALSGCLFFGEVIPTTESVTEPWEEITEIPPEPTGGELELHFTDPETNGQCSSTFPFTISNTDGHTTIHGSGAVDCENNRQQCGDGVCVTYNSWHYLDATIDGILEPATSDYPKGMLNVSALAETYIFRQYWTDIPEGAYMPFTADNPADFTASDQLMNLLFNFAEGATDEISNPGAEGAYPWVFTLHLH